MDKFTGGRRRPTWQSTSSMVPFLVIAILFVAVVCFVVSPWSGGVLLGDGTTSGRLMVWVKTVSNFVFTGLMVGAFTGFLLHQLFLAPAGRHGALKWTALLVGIGAVAAAPLAVVRGMEADRLGYAMRLDKAVAEARTASRRSEQDLYRRIDLLLARDPFDPVRLAGPDGLTTADETIAGHRSLIAEARKDYAAGQIQARAALAGAIVGQMDREAVLERFDEAAVKRRALAETMWGGHDRLIALREQELRALRRDRGAWRAAPGGVTVTSQALLNEIRTIDTEFRKAAGDVHKAETGLRVLDAETDAGIDRVLEAAVRPPPGLLRP